MTPSGFRQRKAKGLLAVFLREISDPFFTPFMVTIEQMADALGYGVVFAMKDNGGHQHVDYMSLVANQADGIIFLGDGTAKLYELELLLAEGKPFVCFQSKKLVEGASYLSVDNEQASYDAMARLVDCGHKRIVHITAPMYHHESMERSRGYERAVKAFQLEYQNKIHIDYAYDSIYDMGCRMAEIIRNERLTAAYCFNNKIATGIIDGLMDQGIVVPKDLSVIGFDDLSFRDLSRNWVPALSSVRQPRETIAAYAVEKVVDMLENGIYDASKVFQCEFEDRDSVRML